MSLVTEDGGVDTPEEVSLEQDLLSDSEKIANREITNIQIEVHDRLQKYYDDLDQWGQAKIGTMSANQIQQMLDASVAKAKHDLKQMFEAEKLIILQRKSRRDVAIKMWARDLHLIHAS